MFSGDPLDEQEYRVLLADFRQQYPQYAVNLVPIPDPANYDTRLASDYAAGAPPDVAVIDYRRVLRLAERNLLEPLGPRLAASAVLSEGAFYAETLLPFQGGQGLWCLPRTADTLAVYYNRAVFDTAQVAYPEPKWTWADFVTKAVALTRDTTGDGQTDLYGVGWQPALDRVAPLIWQGKGELVDRPVFPRELTINSPAAFKGLRWFTNLQVELKVAPDAVAEASEPLPARFLSQRLAMWIAPRRATALLRASAPFHWDVAPLPRNWGRQVNLLLMDGYCLAAQSQHKDAAWAFIEYAASAAGQTRLANSGRIVPTLPRVAESPAFLDPTQAPAHAQVFLDNLPHARAFPMIDNWVNIQALVDNELERAFYDQITIYEAMNNVVMTSEEYFRGYVK
jgi:multiple sugar transport system substrate-binding protein